MSEDIYFWTKNGRPDPNKDHDRNSFCHYMLSNVKTQGVIIKTYHLKERSLKDVNFLEDCFSHQDFTPFVKYSLNKKRRWETNGNSHCLANLQENHPDMKVMLSERVEHRCSPYFCYAPFPYYFDYFKVKQLHELNDSTYEVKSTKSVFGQPYKNFLLENRLPGKPETKAVVASSKPIVAYHLITTPKNFEQLKNKDFHPGRHDKKGHRTLAHWRRIKTMEDNISSLKYDQFEEIEERMDMTDDDSFWELDEKPKKL
ncbi:CRE-IRG-2 protein [Caenorhabditis remanei]|uniref:CRE-IRG-2 protein n=1 Tax=Caenorhabditis remanei TaxID=31234 RepID=E3LI29_CAERE|nr:CRE-IRG-2 protein [Caenorhabditis remanei]